LKNYITLKSIFNVEPKFVWGEDEFLRFGVTFPIAPDFLVKPGSVLSRHWSTFGGIGETL
jgi:hypothetical protein